MPDKDFEQQVRDGLQEWRIAPSERVWSAVSGRIGKRRRRGMFFWLFPALGWLCVGGWWWYQGEAVQPSSQRHIPTHSAGQLLASKMPAADPSAAQRVGQISARGSTQMDGQAETRRSAHTNAPMVPQRAGQQPLSSSQGAPPAAREALRPEGPSIGPPLSPASLQYARSLPEVVVCAPCYTDPTLAFHSVKGGTGTNTSQDHLSGKWQFRLYGGAGLSGQGSAFHFNLPSGSQLSAGYTSSVSGGGTPIRDTVAARKTGGGGQVGFGWSRRLSARWMLGTGLEYDFWETAFDPIYRSGSVTSPGNLSTSTSPGFSAGAGGTYVNHYHLLQVPLLFTWQISPRLRWNPSLYSGVSLGYLFSGDALMYAPVGSGYVKNSDLWRHWSGYWEAGLTFDLWHRGKYVLNAGPLFQYGLSGIQKSAAVIDHLNYAGIQLGLTWPRK